MGGIETDIIAIKQVDNLTVLQMPTTDITISKSIDTITIKDIEDVLSGTSTLAVEITARKQVDEVTVVQAPPTNIIVLD